MRIAEMRVLTPRTLEEALGLLAEHRDRARPLAGGTDLMVRVKEGHHHLPYLIHIRRLAELNGILVAGGRVEVGAAVSFARLLRSEILKNQAPLLLQAASGVGAAQIQAMGTIGGNLGTASPAGDMIPALYALEAEVRLVSVRGERWVAVDEFFWGPGRTVREPDELIRSVRFAPQPPGERFLWQKLGLRGAQAIAIISLAMRLQLAPDEAGAVGREPGAFPGRIGFARLAYGAVGPTVLRARNCEQALVAAESLDEGLLRAIAGMAQDEVRPISDIRASAEYRRAMAGALLQRGALQLLGLRADGPGDGAGRGPAMEGGPGSE